MLILFSYSLSSIFFETSSSTTVFIPYSLPYVEEGKIYIFQVLKNFIESRNLQLKKKANPFCHTYACYFSKINKMFRSPNKFINYLLYSGQNIAGKLKNELFIFGGAGNEEQ